MIPATLPEKSPTYFKSDPGEGWERWTSQGGYVYQSDTSGTWWALNPYGPQATPAASQDEALDAYYGYFGSADGGGSGMTQSDQEFVGGISSGLSPAGPLVDFMNAARRYDVSSREYRNGVGIGFAISTGLTFGLGSIDDGARLLTSGTDVPNAGGVIRSFTFRGTESITSHFRTGLLRRSATS
jgi:hypothetical protein